MKKAAGRNVGLCKLWKKLSFWALEHVFNKSIEKSFRKKLLIHQMRYYFLCKISTYSPATQSVSTFAVVAVQIMHLSAVA